MRVRSTRNAPLGSIRMRRHRSQARRSHVSRRDTTKAASERDDQGGAMRRVSSRASCGESETSRLPAAADYPLRSPIGLSVHSATPQVAREEAETSLEVLRIPLGGKRPRASSDEACASSWWQRE